MIFEAIVSTRNADSSPHYSPMGYRMENELVVLAPFVPSRTLENLRREGEAVLNLTDDVSVMAGCLTGRKEWPGRPCAHVAGWCLEQALAHKELRVTQMHDDDVRPTFYLSVVYAQTHRPFSGFNRAQSAVVEAAILLSRLDWLEPEKVALDMTYLSIAIEKTAGDIERKAWNWIVDAVQQHERHDLRGVLQR